MEAWYKGMVLRFPMHLKPPWKSYLAAYRAREFRTFFASVPPHAFANALELGAGHGYHTALLRQHTQELVSTDFSPLVLRNPTYPNVTNRVCDAERVDEFFPEQIFDLVFSSSLFEHLPEPHRALAGIRRVLRDDGLTIHIMPNPFWKLTYLGLYYPALFLTAVEMLSRSKNAQPDREPTEETFENNQKLASRRSRLVRVLFPEPHGVEHSHWREFAAFSKRRWVREFAQAGFEIVSVLKGPITSGHGFGWNRLRAFLEKRGLSSVYAYVAKKEGRSTPYAKFFTDLPNAVSAG